MTLEELIKMLDAKDTDSSVRKRAMDDDMGYVYDPKNPPKARSRQEMYEAMEDMKSEKGYSKGGLVKGFKGTF